MWRFDVSVCIASRMHHTHTHLHTHTHVHTRTHTYTHVYTRTHTYTHVHTYTHTQSHTHTHVHTHTHTLSHTHTHTHTHAHTHTYTHTHTHTHTHTYTHTHTHTHTLGVCFGQQSKPWECVGGGTRARDLTGRRDLTSLVCECVFVCPLFWCRMTTQVGFRWMGVMVLAVTGATIPLLHWSAWGGIFRYTCACV